MRFDKLFSSAHFSLLKTLIQKTFEGNKDTLQLHFLPLHWQLTGSYNAVHQADQSINKYLENTLEFQTYLYTRT